MYVRPHLMPAGKPTFTHYLDRPIWLEIITVIEDRINLLSAQKLGSREYMKGFNVRAQSPQKHDSKVNGTRLPPRHAFKYPCSRG